MDAQDQAKISAMSKKQASILLLSINLHAVQMQPILDGLQKVLEAVLERKPEVKAGETPEPGGPKKGKGGNRTQTSAPSETSTNASA